MESTKAPPPQMHRRIGLFGLTFAAIGAIIGSGWLFAPLYAAKVAGPAAIISWVIGALMVAILAMPFAELGAALRVPGGCTRYAQVAFGGTTSFLTGWLCWLGYVAIPTVETIAILEYLGDLAPWLVEVRDGDRSLSVGGSVVAAGVLLTMVIANLIGVQWLNRSNGAITIWKLFVPALTAVVLLIEGFNPENFTSHGFAPEGVGGVLAALGGGGVVFSLFGYRVVVDLAGEARRPQRDLPLAILGGLLACALLFVLLQLAFVGAVPPEQLEEGWSGVVATGASGPLAAFALTLGLGWLASVLYVDATISPYGCGLIYTGANARLLLAMGRNRNVPAVLGRIDRRGIPSVAILVNFGFALVLLAPLPAWDELTAMVAAAVTLTAGIGAVAFLRLRRTHPDLDRPFRVPVGTVAGVLAFAIASLITFWCGWSVLRDVLVGLAVGAVLLLITVPHHRRRGTPLDPRAAIWLVIWIGGLALIAWLGDHGGGLGTVPSPWADLAAVALAFVVLPFATRSGLRREDADTVLAEIRAESTSDEPPAH